MKNHWNRRIASTACALALAAVTYPSWANGPAPDSPTRHFEVDFLEGMIDHHGMAVGMAELCLQKQVRPALRASCEKIASTQKAEITRMQAWLDEWYGISRYTPKMKPRDQRDMRELGSQQGTAFEKTFLEMMTPHHAIAIKRSADCLVLGYHSELLDQCKSIAKDQADEVRTMRTWLCDWFSQCIASMRMRHMLLRERE